MKKFIYMLSIIVVCIISFNVNIIKKIDTKDSDPYISITSLSPSQGQIYNNSYMINYFSNLRNNMTKNFGGSCTFVALTSLLSYYDSWYNDDIIPDYFDVRSVSTIDIDNALLNSPGAKNISNSISNWKNGDETADFLVNNMLNDFECHLMWNAFSNNITSSRWLAQLNFDEIQDVLNAYYGVGTINCISHTFNSNISLSEKERIIKNYIDQGIPCLVTITRTGGAHAVVAYDYDSNNIYANFGWKNSSGTTYGAMLNTYYGNLCYTNISYVMTLSFSSFPLTSSSNYYVSTGSEKGYYVNNGATLNMHKHNISSIQLNNSHNYYCSDCAYNFEVEHDVTSYNIYNNLNHIENCSLCGSSVHEHVFKYIQYTKNYHKKVCELCGSTMNERHEYVLYNLEKNGVNTTFNMCKYCAKVSE